MQSVDLAFDELGHHHAIPLLIVHGFFASSRNWRKIAEKLADRFHVFVLDMRNHGKSPHHELMDYPAMTADVLRFMEARQIPSAHILGHSMGGKVAMWLALTQPERMKKLIVVDIAPKSYSHSFRQIINAMINLPITDLQNRKQADEWLTKDIPELSYRQFLLQNLIFANGKFIWRINLDIFRRQAEHIVAFPETDNLLPYLGEVLFVIGENSNFVNKNDSLRLFPKAVFKQIAQAGHWLHVEQPELFLAEIEKFLQ